MELGSYLASARSRDSAITRVESPRESPGLVVQIPALAPRRWGRLLAHRDGRRRAGERVHVGGQLLDRFAEVVVRNAKGEEFNPRAAALSAGATDYGLSSAALHRPILRKHEKGASGCGLRFARSACRTLRRGDPTGARAVGRRRARRARVGHAGRRRPRARERPSGGFPRAVVHRLLHLRRRRPGSRGACGEALSSCSVASTRGRSGSISWGG